MGSLAVTNQGNMYKRTDAGKVLMPTLTAGAMTAGLITDVVREHKLFKERPQFRDPNNYKQAGESVLKYAKRFLFGEKGKPALANVQWGKLGLVLAAAIGVGAILDGVVNKIRAHAADKK